MPQITFEKKHDDENNSRGETYYIEIKRIPPTSASGDGASRVNVPDEGTNHLDNSRIINPGDKIIIRYDGETEE